jgi:hypothetical protein
MVVIKSSSEKKMVRKNVHIIPEYINSVHIMDYGLNVGLVVKENGIQKGVKKVLIKRPYYKID